MVVLILIVLHGIFFTSSLNTVVSSSDTHSHCNNCFTLSVELWSIALAIDLNKWMAMIMFNIIISLSKIYKIILEVCESMTL